MRLAMPHGEVAELDDPHKSKPCMYWKWVWGLPVRCRGRMAHYGVREEGRLVERYLCLNDYTHTDTVYGREDEGTP